VGLPKLLLQPGANTLATKTLAKGTWIETNCVRFREGFLEKNFGWQRLSDDQVAMPAGGTARSLHGLTDTDGFDYLAIGSNTNLEIYLNGQIYDITPLRATVDVAVSMDTVINTPTVTVTDVAHGAATGDEVEFVIPVAIGGLIIWGNYIVTVVDVDNYTITASSNATATVNNGGAVPTFTTTFPGTPTVVTVTLAAHGLSINDIFYVEVSTTVGGVVIVGAYLVQTVPTADTFTITTSAAGSAATGGENGGNARILYLLAPGPATSYLTQGYGSGTYGSGTWGEGDGASTFLIPLRYWFLENIGETLVAAVSQGTLYEWTSPVTSRATEVTAAPDIMTAMYVAMPATCVVALGAEVLGIQDPLLVRWSDSGDYNDWIASVTNQAGSYRLSHGQKIIGGFQGPMSGMIWTDDALWQMQYVGPPFIFTFKLVDHGCGLIAPLAMGVLNSIVYWMGANGFFRYGSGSPESIPCPIWDTIFQDFDDANGDKCICGISATTDEIYWFYPSLSGGTGEIDSYVRVNTNGQWDFGQSGTLLARTAWGSTEGGFPPSVDLNSYLQLQETGYDADGSAMTGVLARSGYMDIDEGQDMSLIDQIIPDFKWKGTDPEVQMTFYAIDDPSEDDPEQGNTPRSFGPYTVTPDTKWFTILPAIRARQISVEITSDGEDMWWRLGAIRYRLAKAGRRPQTGG
jgi:hypothetical protein